MFEYKVTLFYHGGASFTCKVKSYGRASVLFHACEKAHVEGFPETFVDYKIEEIS